MRYKYFLTQREYNQTLQKIANAWDRGNPTRLFYVTHLLIPCDNLVIEFENKP